MAETLSDATLLERFVNGREEAAFAALVRRHGPRVERICRRILRNEQDVEDILQATFLVLSRKAAELSWLDSVSPWVDSVARRLAMHARSGAARQRGREMSMTSRPGMSSYNDGRLPERYHPRVEPSTEVERREMRHIIDDELGRLPEKYRAPVVLCDLEGHTREEAARRLGWPTGSMSRRLDRARTLLRQRLTCRGLALAALGVASMAIAAAVGLGPDRDRRDGTVRQAMSPFKPVSEGGQGHGPLLAQAAQGNGLTPDFALILPAAREAVAAARQMDGRRDGPMGALWDLYAGDMKRSALDVEGACRDSDSIALLTAARRLDASCVNCHTVFRQGEARGGLPVDPPSYRPDPPEPADQPRSIDRDPERRGGAQPSWPSMGGPSPPDAVSRPGPAVSSLRVPSRMASSAGTAPHPGPPARPPMIPVRSASQQLASNEWVVAAVRSGWAPSIDQRRRSATGARPT